LGLPAKLRIILAMTHSFALIWDLPNECILNGGTNALDRVLVR
jgi:hypothetical protein